MRLAASALSFALLAGCSLVYRMDIQQGNYVTEDVAAKLRPGMSKAEVRTLLGTPLLIDAFHANRWDYYFANHKSGQKPEQPTRLSVFFENDKVVDFYGGSRAALPPPVGSATAPAPQIK
jgi:outer membrane protein assembly factor BamE